MAENNNFSAIQIGLASPEKIREWSYGEVKKPETINYRSQKPEKDGLFCERIFGPTKDWECACGKYKKVRYKGVVCDRCGVEVTRSSVRRERMGHIELATPVAHIWYLKGVPSRMGLILDMSPKQLEEIIYFVSYVVTDKGSTPLEYKQVLSERDYRNCVEKFGGQFQAKIGAEAIKVLLQKVDLDAELEDVENQLKEAQGQKRQKLLKRLEAIDAFRSSNNQPEWMIMDVLPVIPPDLRPMLQLDGGRFATSDLNDLYRRVITRNNRLKKLLELGTPSIIVQNEKRMLQESVDALIDNGRRSKPITGAGGRALKSLSHTLKGKQGRFRQNLLGKRVDYSGRSVIAVGPTLKMYQCGIPREMAVNLFKPFVISGLVRNELATNIKAAERMIDKMDDKIWPIVEDVIKHHPVLLNRAPTLHRLGIQAFEPKLVEGRAIRLHPLACPAFNADFDGDQMAIHAPLGEEAIQEARQLMLGSRNILGPKDGKPIVTPSQDMVLGNYYLTTEKADQIGEGTVFADVNEVLMAYYNKTVNLHTRIAIRAAALKNKTFTEEQNNMYLVTTVGKIIFNQIFEGEFPYLNDPDKASLKATPMKYFLPYGTDIKAHIKAQPLIKQFTKKTLGAIIDEYFKICPIDEIHVMLDRLKNQGFYYSTIAGITVSAYDIQIPQDKYHLFDDADEHLEVIKKLYNKGKLTEHERYTAVIKLWNDVKEKVTGIVKEEFEADRDNPIFIMSDSGARGNISNFTQLVGMRGLMSNPKGETIELPIKSNFREGLDVLEYFISAHGARKGLSDTALRTADSGYLTRRLVDVSQDLIIRETDCSAGKQIPGMYVYSFVNNRATNSSDAKEDILEPLQERITGRYLAEDIVDPATGEVIVEANHLVTPKRAEAIIKTGVDKVKIRTILTCRSHIGVCAKCYGTNMATGQTVQVGEAVGIIAAQSIGEPGTQLTMRTFHTGGVAGDNITQGLPRVEELFEARKPKMLAVLAEFGGTVSIVKTEKKTEIVITDDEGNSKAYPLSKDTREKVVEGQVVAKGEEITEGSENPHDIVRILGVRAVQDYLLREVQKVYRIQGVDINDKHIELIVRQMLKKIVVDEAGDSKFLPGSQVDTIEFQEVNERLEEEGKTPATGTPIILGITKASLASTSFMSAASFQETTKVLTDAAINGKIDPLIGLKENVIIGKLIPAGTGMKRYQDIKISSTDNYIEEDEDESGEDELVFTQED